MEQSAIYIASARSALKSRAARRNLGTSVQEAPFAMLGAVGFMTCIFGAFFVVLFGPIGLFFGLAASLVFFYFYIERQNRADILDLDDWSNFLISEGYCKSIHPDRDRETWRAMDAIRKSRN